MRTGVCPRSTDAGAENPINTRTATAAMTRRSALFMCSLLCVVDFGGSKGRFRCILKLILFSFVFNYSSSSTYTCCEEPGHAMETGLCSLPEPDLPLEPWVRRHPGCARRLSLLWGTPGYRVRPVPCPAPHAYRAVSHLRWHRGVCSAGGRRDSITSPMMAGPRGSPPGHQVSEGGRAVSASSGGR